MLKGQLSHWNPHCLTIQRTPRVGEVFWIGIFSDAVEPEFTGYHPGIIVRGCSDLNEETSDVSFVPVTSKINRAVKPYIYPLTRNPNPLDKCPVWAICNHIYTVRPHRLERYFDGKKLVTPRLEASDIDGVFNAITLGFTALETRIRSEIVKREAALRIALEAEYAARFEAELEVRVARELDMLTAPAGV
jgi:uncharacterized protein YifN (PemK superfamily)